MVVDEPVLHDADVIVAGPVVAESPVSGVVSLHDEAVIAAGLVGAESPMFGVLADFAASDHDPSPLPVMASMSLVSFMKLLSAHINQISISIPNHICTYLSSIHLDLDTLIPSYISDKYALMFLAAKCLDQSIEPVVFGPTRPLVPYSDDEVVNQEQPVLTPARKRRSHKLKEPLGERFLRRSTHRNPALQGFKDLEMLLLHPLLI